MLEILSAFLAGDARPERHGGTLNTGHERERGMRRRIEGGRQRKEKRAQQDYVCTSSIETRSAARKNGERKLVH